MVVKMTFTQYLFDNQIIENERVTNIKNPCHLYEAHFHVLCSGVNNREIMIIPLGRCAELVEGSGL